MTDLFLFASAVRHDPAVGAWMEQRPAELGVIAKHWFDVMRARGNDVRELLHDGHPTACVDEAAFAYVNVFTKHVNVGFFRGTALPDPMKLLDGTGRYMRHVKLRPGENVDGAALERLIDAAYMDMKERLNRLASKR